MSPRTALYRTLLAAAAFALLLGTALTAPAPRARWLVGALVAFGAVQTVREGRRYWALRQRR